MHRWRAITFDGWLEKAQYLDGAAWMDARILPGVRDTARRIARPYGAISPEKLGSIARDLFRLVQRNVRYTPDPASEEFSDAQQTLEQGAGDCDDKVRCFIALCRAIKVEAIVRPVMANNDFAHVQALVRYPGSEEHPRALADGWLVAELILRDAQLGDDVHHVATRALS